MKTILKSVFFLLVGIVFSSSIMLAQQQVLTKEQMQQEQMRQNHMLQGQIQHGQVWQNHMQRTHMAKPLFTDDQKAMLKANRQKIKDMRDAFRATLTQAQKDILSDPRLIKIDRERAFRASFTDKQVKMIKARQQEVKADRVKFRSTLSEQQKMQLKRMAAIKNNKNQKGYNNHIGYNNQANIKRDRVHR